MKIPSLLFLMKRPTLLLALGAMLRLLAGTLVSAAPTPLERTDESIAALHEHHFLEEPEYWQQNATATGKCDGAKVAKMLVEVAQVFKDVPTTTDAAIAALVKHGVISAPEAWTKGTAAGATMNGANVATVLNRCAAQLPVAPPKSAKAAPLEATPPSKLKGSYDVVIAGAGTGGVGAAVQAARMGRSVLLLEETDWIGGQMNAAAVTSMDEGVPLVRERGLYRELCGLIGAHYQPLGIHYLTAYWNGHVCVEPRVGRHLLHVLLGDARGQGVLDLALRTRVTKVTRSGDTVTGVEIESVTEAGREAHTIASKVLVDATEWGDVIPLTGARYRVGNCTSDAIDPTRRVQDNTWTAVVKQYPQGVPEELVLRQAPPGYTDKVAAYFAHILVDGDKIDIKAKPWTWATFIGYRAMPDSSRPGDSPPITRTHLNYGNDYHSSVAEIENPAVRLATSREMRLKTLQLLYYLQHTLGKTDWSVANDEGFDSPYNRAEIDRWLTERPELAPYRAILYHFSVMAYARESRRIIGLYTLTAHEIERIPGPPVQFAHSVALGDYPVDMHGSMTVQYLEPELDHASDIPHDKFGAKGIGPFAIPFECFIPEKIDGFLPAEKNLSESRMVNGATRLQPHTLNMGQAVGAIAALAVQHGVPPRAVDPVEVQRVLLAAGDTLCIGGAPGTRWGTPEWRDKQLSILRDGAPAEAVKP
ncbi:MAG: FAD-dependent oxidoreductase [Chthoniobacter sp.]